MVRKKISRSLRVTRYVVYKETLVDFREHLWSFIGSFCAIGTIAAISSSIMALQDNLFLIGSFGASSVLIYGAIQSPLAQPRNLLGGHVNSALVGVTVYQLIPEPLWLSAPLAVSLSIVLMQVTKTLHPPGGATALLAVIGSEKITSAGYLFVLTPVLSGCLILLLFALIFNNLTPNRKYPTDHRFTHFVQKAFRYGILRKSKNGDGPPA